ncbi:TIGR04141 family sporadically distributed protein [Streptococcus suis]|uniref:Sporadically distributed protein n=1 Tax=Streptococcus suis TaxID=1307 RepID=A0A0Z8VD88_STRSU|nr:TIGR04141 family sporadically distributed protein [Streptococcus suis]MCK4076131.1 TIGR04141 family sporadically distributed protein [Streptococcus suis]NQH51517.1 TIGR04141 family sporadically distributed protein [Streptococcus suis]NQO22441.1 TIGR04141 family sporadically distributed protein [Streptococcus suis]NQO81428.1 TIGR04141 family sporadically distributed protein [Streptococcus suis]NQO89869.1 TIGR04141 family sporadically distributed protein [Streptococcus suis]
MKKDSMTLNIHNTKHFEHCLKKEVFESARIYDVDFNKVGLVGKIVIAEPKEKELRWHSFLNSLTQTDIPKLTNKTNKAILLIKRKNYVFSVSYGYGYVMIEDTTVVKDFGMKVTANMVSEKQIKSTNSFNFQDTPFNVQRQVQGFSGIDVFQNGSHSEILKSISGVPVDKETFSFTTGSDSLKVSINFVDNSIKDALDRIIDYYESESYKEKGMDWIDNIRLMKDKITIAELDNELIQKIKSNPSEIVIDTNRLHNWQEVGGFRITGMGARQRKGEGHEYMFEIPSLEYFKFLNEGDLDNVSFLNKLKRDTLNYHNTQSDSEFKICNIYSSITGEITYKNNRYFIYDGSWYKLSEDFYNETITKIRKIPLVGSDFQLPICNFGESEGDYNFRATTENQDLFLLWLRASFSRREKQENHQLCWWLTRL